MGRRTLLLITSVFVAALGVALIAVYIKHADQRAAQQAERKYHGPPPAPSVTPSPTRIGHHQDIRHLGITIDVQPQDRAVGLLLPGDQVAIYALEDGVMGANPIVSPITVIAVGPARSVNGSTGEAVPTTVLGLDATPGQAHLIWQAEHDGSLTVAVIGRHAAPRVASTNTAVPTPSQPI